MTINIEAPGDPKLAVSRRSEDFGLTERTKMIQIQNVGTGLMEWRITDDKAWLTVTPTSGNTRTEKDTVRLTVNRAGLTPGLQDTASIVKSR